MRIAFAILLLTLLFATASAQYYLRGEIRDEKGNTLFNAKLKLQSSNLLYYSGVKGSFGIVCSKESDTLFVSLDGYQDLAMKVEAGRYHIISLKMLYSAAHLQRNKLVSLTRDLQPEERKKHLYSGETYSSLVENEFVLARKYPETGFAIHADRAAYSNIRRFLNMQTTVPPDAVRTEELLNYFNFDASPLARDSIFGFRSYISDCPWDPQHQLLYLNIASRKIDSSEIPPSNLVFLVDVSGSMDMPNRLPLLKSSFKLLVDNLLKYRYGFHCCVWKHNRCLVNANFRCRESEDQEIDRRALSRWFNTRGVWHQNSLPTGEEPVHQRWEQSRDTGHRRGFQRRAEQ